MSLEQNIAQFEKLLAQKPARLVAISKTHPTALIEQAYQAGQRIFGENKAQEISEKYEVLPKDIEWHFIGTLQSNKVKYIAPFIKMIHSVDRPKILKEINKRAAQNNRVIDCLIQIHIAQEDTKSGFSYEEATEFLTSGQLRQYQNVRICGFMGMATNTEDEAQIRQEFRTLSRFKSEMQAKVKADNIALNELSMGMSGDYSIALEEGSTFIRVGSAIFGSRSY